MPYSMYIFFVYICLIQICLKFLYIFALFKIFKGRKSFEERKTIKYTCKQ